MLDWLVLGYYDKNYSHYTLDKSKSIQSLKQMPTGVDADAHFAH